MTSIEFFQILENVNAYATDRYNGTLMQISFYF